MKVRVVALLAPLIVTLAIALPDGEAQQAGQLRSVGVLNSQTPAVSAASLEGFRAGLRAEGYVEGQNLRLELRFWEGRADRLPSLARELVTLGVDVIFVNGTPGTLAAKKATTTIPIVFIAVGDPVNSGVVASLARPGGNLTGLTNVSVELTDKRLQLFKEALPRTERIAVLVNPTNPASAPGLSELRRAASALGVELYQIEARAADGLGHALAVASKNATALEMVPDGMFVTHRASIAAQAKAAGLPLMGWSREWAEAGALLSYGPNNVDLNRRAGAYVGRILKGAKPEDLPIQQPSKFELVVNLKTAKVLRLTMPPSLLLRADQVIDP